MDKIDLLIKDRNAIKITTTLPAELKQQCLDYLNNEIKKLLDKTVYKSE